MESDELIGDGLKRLILMRRRRGVGTSGEQRRVGTARWRSQAKMLLLLQRVGSWGRVAVAGLRRAVAGRRRTTLKEDQFYFLQNFYFYVFFCNVL